MPDVIETTDAAATGATAYVLTPGQIAYGTLSVPTDQDGYRVVLTAGQTYTFSMVGIGPAGDAANEAVQDTWLTLLGPGGAVLVENDDGGNGPSSQITFTATESGTYTIVGSSYFGTEAGTYGLSVTLGDQADYDIAMGAGAVQVYYQTWEPGTTITWAARLSNPDQEDASENATPFIQATAAQIATFQICLDLISEVGDINFTRVGAGYSNDATILLGAYSADDGAGAYAQFPGSTAPTAVAGDVSLNNQSVDTDASGLQPGGYSFMAILHELGHAVGLSHPGDYNAGPDEVITYDNNALFIQDFYQYSIMSYFDETEATGLDVPGNPDGLMMFDILAIQNLYGANHSTRAGDSIYGFGANTGAVYDFSLNTDPFLCIWDGAGVDTLNVSGFSQSQRIDLRDGFFSNVGGFVNNVSIAIGAVIENATGGSGADTLIGNNSDNVLNGGAGADKLTGGRGSDTYFVDNAGDVVTETNVTGVDLVRSSINYTLTANVENLRLEGSANRNGAGNASVNTLTGNSGNNILDGKAGADTMAGREGNDTYIIDNTGDVASEGSSSWGVDTVKSSVSYTLGTNVENLTLTGSAAINGAGNTLANILNGNAANNTLDGKAGADTMTGGLGNDTYIVDNAGDVVVEASGGGTELIRSAVSLALGVNIENLTLTGSAAINGAGNALNNVLTGNAANNTLDGKAGLDTMTGGAGNDTYIVDNAGDLVVEASGGGTDLVRSAVSFTMGANIENLTLTGAGNIHAAGNSLGNTIVGNSGAGIIRGNGGADIITGGAGNDTFDYDAVADSSVSVFDRITDLTNADRIDLSGIDANVNRTGNQGFAIVNAFSNVAGQMTLDYSSGTGLTTILMDVNGDGVADMKIVANGNHEDFTNFVF